MKKILIILSFLIITSFGCRDTQENKSADSPYIYKKLSRLTDPGDNEDLLSQLPDDVFGICDIANKQLVHYRMLSQWKIPRDLRKTSRALHDIKDILDTLRAKGEGKLSVDRKLENRVISQCTKESIFLTSLLRSRSIPARIRIGYFTNLYRGSKAIEFWQNVNQYERAEPLDTALFNSFTRRNAEVNRSIEHWVTEYWDEKSGQWRLLDARPEYLEAYGVNLKTKYHLIQGENFEYSWQVWKRRNDADLEEEAYSERGWNARTHIRYQLLLDFYSLLNHDGPAIFEDDGLQTPPDDVRRIFLQKDYESLTNDELSELDNLAELMSKNPGIVELIEYYKKSKTLRIESAEKDSYSFVYGDS